MKLHQGVDMKAELGRAVLAPAHGRVVLATERDPEREWLGTVVVVAHGNGLESTFAHLGTLSVATGDQVKMNQVLGTVGVTGNTTGPHLHWEVRQDGELVNPVMLLTAGLRPAATEDC
jgi:murein DD-endopeptidase MepM/ murein hydrolase activator NlpD